MSQADEQKTFREKLEQMLKDLNDVRKISVASQSVVQLDQQAVGRLSRMDAMQQQAMAKATENNRLRDLDRIKAALIRLDDDEFGYCLECGEAIDRKRLDLNPTVLVCITCARG